MAAVMPQQVVFILWNETILVPEPKHAHGIFLRLVIRAGIARGDADEWNFLILLGVRVVVDNLLRERRHVNSGVRLPSQVELILPKLWKLAKKIQERRGRV